MSEEEFAAGAAPNGVATGVAVLETPWDMKFDRLGRTVNPYTDLANGRFLVKTHGTDIRCVLGENGNKTWYVWDDTRYRRDDTGEIVRRAKATVELMLNLAVVRMGPDDPDRDKMIAWAIKSQDDYRISRMVGMAASEEGVAVRSSEFDADPYLLNVENGVLDLRTFELREHDRRYMMSLLAPTVYHPQGDVIALPRWSGFLEGLFPDPEVRKFVQTAVGYSLLGKPREDCLFFLYGPPRTGKTTFLEAVRGALGEYASTFKFELLLATTYDSGSGNASPELMSLEGRRFVTAAETKSGRRLDEGKIKWITGGDTIRGRALYKDEREFTQTHTVWITANDAPRAKDDDAGLWTRIHRIPAGERQRTDPDPRVREAVLDPENREAILAWAVDGLYRYHAKRLVIPSAVRRSTSAWRAEGDPLTPFLEEACVIGDAYESTPAELWIAYQQYEDEQRPEVKIKSKVAFGRRMSDRFKHTGSAENRDKIYLGVKPRQYGY